MNTYEMLEEAAHRAYTRGIQTGNGGNLSARADFGMIVKSSGGSFADCLADGTGFVETDLDGSVLSPSGKPTREVVLHGLMYKLCPECGGVRHWPQPVVRGLGLFARRSSDDDAPCAAEDRI